MEVDAIIKALIVFTGTCVVALYVIIFSMFWQIANDIKKRENPST